MHTNKILEFISLCEKIWGFYPEYSGGCYKFSKLLISVFGGEMYWTTGHVITVIEGVAYDKNGITELTDDFFKVGSKDCTYEFIERIYKEYL
tara:strand:- start:1629 stop:1904 length:276 start_codon:yes stop_codon:yes gene_type:complete